MKHLKSFNESISDVKLVVSENFDDYKELYALTKEFGEIFYYHMNQFCTDVEDKLKNPDWKVFLIYEGSDIAGVIGKYKLDTESSEYWLGWFGILEKYRGQGVATIAINKLMNILRQEGATKLILYTEKNNFRAQKFYQKEGFEILCSVDDYCEQNNLDKEDCFTLETDDLVMYKNL